MDNVRDLTEHPATIGVGLCRVTTMVGDKEFICVLPVHDSGKKSDQNNPDGRPARWRRHHFVRRYPYRDM